ncbi:MAG: DNA-protecting protein DprA [Actinobacteria bacterium]|nr:MAG: DNA-protecting protein DprA [Actinomycetota bacterium]
MNELALAAFAAERDAHLVKEPRDRAYAAFARRFDAAAYLASLREAGVRWLGRSDPGFPPLLRAIHDPPAGLFVRGDAEIDLLRRATAAIVGARSCSPYGAQVARMLGRELAGAGLVVVSGLARGIDGEAHRGALEGGTTIAVLGCGIDRDYPAANAELAARVRTSGLAVSEYAPGVEPAPWRFPARNRIIAGLAAATVVVEARERSGALITADLALEEGREVFAVPGEITSALSRGTNDLLRLGATPLLSSEDVLELFGLSSAEAENVALSEIASTVLRRLRDGSASADELARATSIDAGALASALTELELAGVAVAAGGVYRAN